MLHCSTFWGFFLSLTKPAFSQFQFFQLLGPIIPHYQTWTDMDKTKGVKKTKMENDTKALKVC